MTQSRIARALFALGLLLPLSLPAADSPDPRGPLAASADTRPPEDLSGPVAPPSPSFAYLSQGYRSIHFDSDFSGSPAFVFPYQVSADASNVFVSDVSGNVVQMFQLLNGGGASFVRGFGAAGSGPGQFNGPEQVAVVGNDIYIADFSNSRVQRFNKTTGAYVSQFGTAGSGAGQLSLPSGLVYNPSNGLLYVSEVGNDRIQAFTTSGTYQFQFGSLGSGNGQINNPYSMAVDSIGNIYVADTANGRVAKFDASGAWLRNLAAGVSAPSSVAVDKANMVWVTSGSGDIYCYDARGNYNSYYYGSGTLALLVEGYFSNIRGIAVSPPLSFAPYNGSPAVIVTDGSSLYAQIFSRSAQPTAHPALPGVTGLSSYNHGIAFDSAENVYITSYNGSTITKFDKFGTYLTQWGSAGTGNGQFSGLMGIAIDDSDNVYVTDRNNNRIQKFDSNGGYIMQWGALGSGNGQFNHPSGIATDGAWLYVTEEVGNRIQKFSFTGGYVRQWGSSGTGDGQFNVPVGIAVDRNRNQVYVSEYSGDRVQQFTVFGDFIKVFADSTSGPGMLNGPLGLATDQHGNIYVADYLNSRIVQFNDNGTYLANFAAVDVNGLGINPKNGQMYSGTVSSGTVTRLGAPIGKYDTVGTYRPSTQTFLMRNGNIPLAPYITAPVALAQPTDIPITGDWNGDGIDTPGLYRPSTSTFYLWDRWTGLNVGAPDITFTLGSAGDRPIVGDWDGDGRDGVGTFRPSTATLNLRNVLTAGGFDYSVNFGIATDIGIAGDWDQDGASSAGVFRPSGGQFYATNHNANGTAPVDGAYPLGNATDLPITGDWTHSGYSAPGVYRQLTDTFYLKYDLDGTPFNSDVLYRSSFEAATADLPLAGTWGSAPE